MSGWVSVAQRALNRLKTLAESFRRLCQLSEAHAPRSPQVKRAAINALDRAAESLWEMEACRKAYGCPPATQDRMARIEEWATLSTADKAEAYESFALDITAKAVHEGGPMDEHSWGEQLAYWIDILQRANSVEESGHVAAAFLSEGGSLSQEDAAARATGGIQGRVVARPEQEQRDEKGFVTNPADPSAYRPATRILADFPTHAPTYKDLTRILAKHPEIRRWKPNKWRLSVHLGDWQKYVDSLESTDDEGFLDDPAEIAERKAKINKAKTFKGKKRK